MAIKEKPVHKNCDQNNKKLKMAKDEDYFRILTELEKEYVDVLAELAK